MLLKETLREIVRLQRKELESMDIGIKRDILKDIDLKITHITILSGVRRCGKSTLLKQIMKDTKKFYYFNFEDQRALNFELNDFEKLDQIFHEEFGECNLYFFDEIQNVNSWEMFVRKMHDNGKKVIITGSNASLLSKELGTKLTGRHINYEVFPFSFSEILNFEKLKITQDSFKRYMRYGGFPEFLKYKKAEILQELLNDILVRDIIARYSLREAKILKEIAIHLLTNVGKEFSYTNLAKQFNLGSTNTVISYISYFEDSYLIFSIPKFDYSYRKRRVNPKKVYSIDVGLSNANSASFSEDLGRIFENVFFLALRRKYKEIYYFKGKRECDFLIKDGGRIVKAIQVCLSLNEENKEREIQGLKEAMNTLKLKDGVIVTLDQEDNLDGIEIKSFLKWFKEIP